MHTHTHTACVHMWWSKDNFRSEFLLLPFDLGDHAQVVRLGSKWPYPPAKLLKRPLWLGFEAQPECQESLLCFLVSPNVVIRGACSCGACLFNVGVRELNSGPQDHTASALLTEPLIIPAFCDMCYHNKTTAIDNNNNDNQ